jgi:hypothetical protein
MHSELANARARRTDYNLYRATGEESCADLRFGCHRGNQHARRRLAQIARPTLRAYLIKLR